MFMSIIHQGIGQRPLGYAESNLVDLGYVKDATMITMESEYVWIPDIRLNLSTTAAQTYIIGDQIEAWEEHRCQSPDPLPDDVVAYMALRGNRRAGAGTLTGTPGSPGQTARLSGSPLDPATFMALRKAEQEKKGARAPPASHGKDEDGSQQREHHHRRRHRRKRRKHLRESGDGAAGSGDGKGEGDASEANGEGKAAAAYASASKRSRRNNEGGSQGEGEGLGSSSSPSSSYYYETESYTGSSYSASLSSSEEDDDGSDGSEAASSASSTKKYKPMSLVLEERAARLAGGKKAGLSVKPGAKMSAKPTFPEGGRAPGRGSQRRQGPPAALRGDKYSTPSGAVVEVGQNLGSMVSKKMPLLRLLKAMARKKEGDEGGFQIPPGFLKLLGSKALKMKRSVRIKPLKGVLKGISNVCAEKILADSIDLKEGNQVASVSVFMYDLFLHQFGLKPLAEKQLLEFLLSIAKFHRTSPRVHLFARFCDLVGPPLPLPVYSHYLRVLAELRDTVASSSFTSNVWLRPIDAEDETCCVLVSQAMAAIRRSYAAPNDPQEMALWCHELFTQNAGADYQRRGMVVQVDPLLEAIVREYDSALRSFEAPASYVFSACLAGIHVMNLEAFSHALALLVPGLSTREVEKAFRLALLDGHTLAGDCITLPAFEAAIARLGAPDSFNVAPRLLVAGGDAAPTKSLLLHYLARTSPFIEAAVADVKAAAAGGGGGGGEAAVEGRNLIDSHEGLALSMSCEPGSPLEEEPLQLWMRYWVVLEDVHRFRVAERSSPSASTKKKVRSALTTADTFYPDMSLTDADVKALRSALSSIYRKSFLE